MRLRFQPAAFIARSWGALRLGIGAQLTGILGAIVLLTLFGSVVASWQFLRIQRQTNELYKADRLAMSVLQLHDDLFNLRDRLQVLLNTRQPNAFVQGVKPLQQEFHVDSDRTQSILLSRREDTRQHRIDIGILSSVQSSLPNQIDAMVRLIRVNDWDAAQRRLDTQVRTISEATGQLVRTIGNEVNAAERADLDRISSVQREAVSMLWLVGLLTMMTGALLGWLATRSITHALASLDAGAKTLAKGDFSVRVTSHRRDELGRLAHAFNSMAARLQSLYGELQRSEAQFRSLIEDGADLILLLDQQAVVRYVSPSLRTRLGLDPQQLVGTDVFAWVHPEDLDSLRQAIQFAAAANDAHPALEIRVRHASGRWHTVEVVLNSFSQGAGGQNVILNGRDVTARKVLEGQLLQSQKMQAVGRLAAGVAHDFNNLLTVIQGHCDLQLLEGHGRPAVQSSFQEIREAAERASALIRQLLTFSRQQVTRTRALDLNECIAEIRSMLNRLIGDEVSLEFRPAPELSPIRADAGMIQQVVMNLVVNARDAMPHGGSVLIETKEEEIVEGDPPSRRELPPGRYVVLSVTDTGIGMTPEIRGRIFEPFFTTKEVGKGTGLGLSTVYGIVHQCDGLITVDSAPEKGAAFHIFFPRMDAVDEPASSLPAPAPWPGGEAILLLQEEESLRLMIEDYLAGLGYCVLARSGCRREAMSPLPSGFRPDLVIADLDGNHGEVFAVTTMLRQQFPRLKFLYIVTDAAQELWLRPILSDAAATVRKPFGLHTFSRSLRILLDRHQDALRTGESRR